MLHQSLNFFSLRSNNSFVASKSTYLKMKSSKQVVLYVCSVIILLVPSVRSYQEEVKVMSQRSSKQLPSQIIIHGFLLWASLGFLTPVGILIIRISNKLESGRKLKILYYLHVVTQISSAVLVTAAAALSIRNFDNSFNNCHQRMGLSLYVAVWLQLLTGFFRPQGGGNGRSFWFSAHWVLGTFVSLLGIINTYSGLQAYHKRTSNSSRLWTIIFTTEITCIAIFYLFQDKWEYIQKQKDSSSQGGVSTRPISQHFTDDPKFKPQNEP